MSFGDGGTKGLGLGMTTGVLQGGGGGGADIVIHILIALEKLVVRRCITL